MGHFRSSEDKPRNALVYREAKDRRMRGIVAKFCENNKLQIAILVLMTTLTLMYIFAGCLMLSKMYVSISHNTESFQNEDNAIGLLSYEIKENNKVDFETIENIEYEDEDVEFMFVDASVIPKDTSYYIPDEKIIVSGTGIQFLWDFLKGTHFVIVALSTVMFELCRWRIGRVKGTALGEKYAFVISRCLILGMLIYLFLAYSLLT